jgi:hypothetical protein
LTLGFLSGVSMISKPRQRKRLDASHTAITIARIVYKPLHRASGKTGA